VKHFRLSSQAQRDLDEIWLFIAEDNPDAADRFHDLLLSKFLTLAGQPSIGRSRRELQPNMYGFPVGNYVIFYRETSQHIEIIRVLHGARDIENLF
jgi:toxin ParE1/3/4